MITEIQPPYRHTQAYDQQPIDFIRLTDGRDLAIRRQGHGEHTIIDFHGSPGSRLNPVPRGLTLHKLNINVISFDRPGYGYSTSNDGRRVIDTAYDIRQVSAVLGIETFGIIARSGGVAHALGCAALMPEQVSGVVGMAGAAPPELVQDWTKNMTADNQAKHALAKDDPGYLRREFRNHALDTRINNAAIIDLISPDLASDDASMIQPFSPLGALTKYSHCEGLRVNGDGWYEDVMAVNNPQGWGFDIADVRCPTVFVQGSQDPFVDVRHMHALQRTIPHAASVLFEEMGHFGGLRFIESALSYLVERSQESMSNGHSQQPDAQALMQKFTRNTLYGEAIRPTVIT